MKATRTATGLVVEIDSEAETRAIGERLADVLTPGTVIGLVGPLGAGKTRLVRAIAEALGVEPGAIASPTFVLIHEYEGRMPVYHFDVYRLTSRAAFEDLGPADYWDAGGICLVEWADRFHALLPEAAWTITIEPGPGERRRLTIEVPPAELETLDSLAIFDRGRPAS
jgi:tRNA threonylcarbamoyladenosine biosynthesis protein TsaE